MSTHPNHQCRRAETAARKIGSPVDENCKCSRPCTCGAACACQANTKCQESCRCG